MPNRVVVWADCDLSGGGGTYLRSLARWLEARGTAARFAHIEEWDLRLDDPDAVRFAGHVRIPLPEGIQPPILAQAFSVRPALEFLEAERPDLVVFSNNCAVSNLGARRAARYAGCRWITVEHNCAPDLVGAVPGVLVEDFITLNAASAGSVCVSHYNAGLLADVFSVPRERIRVVWNPVRADFFRPPDDAAAAATRARLGVAPGQLHCMTMGHVVDYKAPDLLVRLVEHHASALRSLGCRFTWAGDGAMLADMRSRVAEAGIGDLLNFAGWDPHPQMLLDSADVLIHLSRNEGFGLAPAEAMAKGRPVIASRVGGLPEVLGDTGFLIDLDSFEMVPQFIDALSILADPVQRVEHGAAARLRAEGCFSERRFAEDMERVFAMAELT
ncbi:glycosyltransferase family 4 protein [Arenibaculum pallidiluteum]|uniref:glycosyltransferase family 4 protein n=1 Tax=Arenibaculum pallidiluteum TaxID=2812559 RepID=UPI001A96A961|nr:glycosyltransferase family 4 protein [Arenibaculum pallidiluteum]